MRQLGHIIAALAAALLCSCIDNARTPAPEEELPVRFEMSFPKAGTRAVPDEDVTQQIAEKTSFEPGDVLHVSGVFILEDGGSETRYGHLTLQPSGIWAAVGSDSRLTWPVEAVSGTFTAYYMPTSNGPILSGNPMELPLGGDYSMSDPLSGTSTVQPYGHAVPILFRHLTTRLVLTDVPDEHEEFWMVERTGEAERIRNSYRLKHNADNSLEFEFFNDPVLNQGTVSSLQDSESGSHVCFHLAPGNYEGVSVNFRGNRPFLSLNINDLGEMLAGESYTVSITGTPGVVERADVIDPWQEEDEPIVFHDIMDINKFIEAINNNREYILDDGTEILTKTKSGSLLLMRDISFDDHLGFIQLNIPSAVVLNGNHHFIKDFRQPLFKRIDGKLFNLGLSNARIEYLEGAPFVGSLALELYSEAVIDNVLLDGVSITIGVEASSTNNAQAGGLIGYSHGMISDVRLKGRVEVSSQNSTGLQEANETIFLGGVVGQLAGSLSGVSLDEGASLVVTNKAVGKGVCNIGGAVGYVAESCQVDDCSLEVTVDNSGSTGFISYVGGVAGRLAGAMSGCNVAGTVKGGNVINLNSSTVSMALTGGLAGMVTNNHTASVEYCNTTADVRGFSGFSGIGGNFGIKAFTGGAIGLSYCPASQVSNCISWGSVTVSPSTVENFLGHFAGGCSAGGADLAANSNQASGTPFVGKDNIDTANNSIL